MAVNDRVGDAYIEIKPVGAGFERGVQDIINRAEKGAQFKVGANTGPAQQAVSDLSRQVENQLGGAWQQAALQVAGYTAAVLGVRRVVEGTINKLSGLFDQLAKAQAGFTAILKSESAGGRLLDDIREFARVSPFVTQELVNYSQQLLGVGQAASTIVPLLENVGDLVASVGGDTQNIGRVLFTLTQIRSIGRLAGQDAMQLQSALIPITKLLAENLGKTTAEVKKMQEAGTISADMVFDALSKAGQKVEGAMANATKNISGARAVLEDTITIMFQNQPVLAQMFEDTYKAILKVADFLGSPDFQLAFDNFWSEVDRVYQASKPLIETWTEFAKDATFVGLRSATAILNVFASTLESIPEPVLEALARVFAIFVTLRAPLMMFQYVKAIQQTVGGLVGANGLVSNVNRATIAITAQGAAAQTTAAKMSGLAAANQQVSRWSRTKDWAGKNAGLGLGLGLGIGSQYLPEDSGLQTVGQFAGMGAMFGPAGAVVGGVIGMVSAIDQAHKKVEETLRQKGLDAANAWNESFREEINVKFFGDFTGEQGLDEYLSDLERINLMLRIANQHLTEAQGKTGFATVPGAMQNEDDIAAWAETVKRYEQILDTQMNNPETKAFFGRVQAAGAQLFTGDSRGNVLLQLLKGEIEFDSTNDLAMVTQYLDRLGLTIDDLATKDITILQNIVDMANNMPTAWKLANDELSKLNIEMEKFAATSKEAYGNWVKATTAAGGDLAKQSAFEGLLNSAQTYNPETKKFGANPNLTTAAGFNQAGLTILAEAERYMTELQEKGFSAGEALVKANERIGSSFDHLQETLQLSDTAFRDLLESAGLWELYTETNRDTVSGTVTEVADKLNITVAALKQILDIQGAIDPNMVITVDADISAAVAKLGYLTAEEMARRGGFAGAQTGETVSSTSKAQRDAWFENAMKNAKGLTAPGGGSILDFIRSERDKQEAERDKALQEAEKWADAVKAATDSLSDSIDQAAASIRDAAMTWVTGIKERTQYESAVSVGRLTRNASSQVRDLSELQAGMGNLRGRGVSDEVLQALGIDNVTDLRQVRKLVRSSDSDLAKLTEAVSERNRLATGIAEAEEQGKVKQTITEAIVDAATRLGFDVTEEQAAAQAATINITANSTPDQIVGALMAWLTSGKVGV